MDEPIVIVLQLLRLNKTPGKSETDRGERKEGETGKRGKSYQIGREVGGERGVFELSEEDREGVPPKGGVEGVRVRHGRSLVSFESLK